MATKRVMLLVAALLLPTLASCQAGRFRQGQNAPAAAVADANEVKSLPPGCACTDIGISGNVDVGARVGCGQHLLNVTGDATWFCYVVDPAGCRPALASDQYPGAYYRACNPDVDVTLQTAGGLNRTLADVISNVPDLQIFGQAMEAAGLMGMLEASQSGGPSGLTVFAPSDSAFEAMFDALGINSTDLLDSKLLKALLLRHIGLGTFTKASLSRLSYVDLPTASPSAFNTVRVSSDRKRLFQWGEMPQVVRVIQLDEPVYDPTTASHTSTGTFGYRQFGAANGVLHVINGVMAPLAEATEALAAVPNLSTFYQALNVTGILETLSNDCPDAASANCPYNPITIWAPTNAAFGRLAADLNVTVAQLLDLPELEDIVLFHITDPAHLNTTVMLTSLAPGDTMPTLFGDNITVGSNTTLVPAGVDPLLGILYAQRQELILESSAPQAASFVAPATVRAYNGVIHAINQVLLPYPVTEAPVGSQASAMAPQAEPPNLY